MVDMTEGWKKISLKDACEVFTDGNWIETKHQSSEGIRLVQTGNIGFGFYKDKADKARYISENTFIELKCTEILPNDLLVSRLPDPVGKSCIIPDLQTKMITGVDCTIIRTKPYLSPDFLLYYQMSNQYLSDVNSKVTGTTRSRISRKNLGLVEISIPPLETQKQIVAVLDKAFAAIDVAKANIEKNLQNAKELFQSKLNQIFTQKGDGWEEKTLGESVKSISTGPFGSLLHKSDYTSHGVPLVNPINMVNKRIVADEKKQVAKEVLKRLGTYVLKTNDVVVARRGEIGRCALVEEKQNGCCAEQVHFSFHLTTNYALTFWLN